MHPVLILATLAAAAEAYTGWTGIYGTGEGLAQYAGVLLPSAAAPLSLTSADTPIAVPAVPVSASKLEPGPNKPNWYKYGYSDANSAKKEVGTADGVVRGAYTYKDANGIEQKVNYVADALGFRVVASNLPQETPLV